MKFKSEFHSVADVASRWGISANDVLHQADMGRLVLSVRLIGRNVRINRHREDGYSGTVMPEIPMLFDIPLWTARHIAATGCAIADELTCRGGMVRVEILDPLNLTVTDLLITSQEIARVEAEECLKVESLTSETPVSDEPTELVAPSEKTGRLTTLIDGREALPVRAIPYVTGWQFSPDSIASNLARRGVGAPFSTLHNLTAYHMPDTAPIPVLPREWDCIVAKLEALEAEIREQYPNDAIGYAAWREKSANNLPSGVFVWLDEFELEYIAKRERELFIEPKREGDDELILAPMLDTETSAKVMEGFGAGQAQIHAEEEMERSRVEFVCTFNETVANGTAIDWRYWMSMKTLTAEESARLMVGLDPDIFRSLDHNGPTRSDTSMQRDRARQIERLALNHGMNKATASEWVSWAKGHKFNIHRLFVVEVECKRLEAQIDSEQSAISGTAEGNEPKSVDWKERVRTIALEYIATHKASDLFPSQRDVCGHVEKIAREQRIYGPQGKPISQSYIQRNAIQGDWWKKNKP